MKLEIPGKSKVIPGSLDRLLKLVKSLDCPGQPWTVGNYAIILYLTITSDINFNGSSAVGWVSSPKLQWPKYLCDFDVTAVSVVIEAIVCILS